jgi:hypothetical protein
MDQPLYLPSAWLEPHSDGPARRSTTPELNLLLLSSSKRQKQAMNENEGIVK